MVAPLLGYEPATWLQNAADAYTASLELRPSDAAALEGRGIMRFNLGLFAEALADLERAVDLNPSREPALRPFIERCRDF